MARRADAARLAPFVVVVGGLVLLGAVAAPWYEEAEQRLLPGDLAVMDMTATTGMELVPWSVVAALAALVCGVGMLVARGGLRRAVSVLALPAGLAGLLASSAPAIESSIDGTVTVAPSLAAFAGLIILLGGLAGLVGPGPWMPSRYDVDVAPADAEWRMASADDHGGAAARYPSPSGGSDQDDGEVEQR